MPPRPGARKGLAALCWLACLASLGLALDSVVLAARLGPLNDLVVAFVVIAAVAGVASAVGFWRYSDAFGGRPRGAAFLLLLAAAWAAAGAWLLDQLIVAFGGA